MSAWRYSLITALALVAAFLPASALAEVTLEPGPQSRTDGIGQARQWNNTQAPEVPASVVASRPPARPTNLIAEIVSSTSLRLFWSDVATDEDGYAIGICEGTLDEFSLLTTVPADATRLESVTGLGPGETYQFVVQAYNDIGVGTSEILTITLPGVSSRGYHPAVVGQPFLYTVTASTDGGAPTSIGLTGSLPPGLTFDPATRRISGTPTQAAVTTATMSARYADWGTLTRPLTLRVIHPPGPPRLVNPIPTQVLAPAGPPVTLALPGFFADPDTAAAVRFDTTLGALDLALLANATPATVSNFLNYVNRRDYDTSIVHRAIARFIVQGGGFKPVPPNFTRIRTDPSPPNEPGVSNLRGTVAMAKMSGNPASATDQWFVNLKDNSANLDNQNGGFTVFGRVCGNGLTVVDAIAALPVTNYTVKIDGKSQILEDWPLNTPPPAPAKMDPAKLVLVKSATPIPPLSYHLSANSLPHIATAVVAGTNLVITPASAFGGVTTLTVTATDLDGNSLAQSVVVELDTPYTAWLKTTPLAGTESSPTADVDGDGMPNVVEFALAGSPTLPDRPNIMPVGSVASVQGSDYAALKFRLRKALGGATVTLQTSPALAPAHWTPAWTNTDPDAQVVERKDLLDYWLLTVRDATPFSLAAPHRFLRLLVTLP